jgi:phosphoribosylformylglycinamidine cyclo-ligase
MEYRHAGVDIDAAHALVRRVRQLARTTFTAGVLSDLGLFGGLFHLAPGRFRDPVLVASADGVGTKLKVAQLVGRHDTVGADLVNHCVNDVLVQGATPLFFLDYFATGHLRAEVALAVLEGIVRACRENGCALLGGETAEMPGFYAEGEYELAGFIVGVVERDRIVDGRGIRTGDLLVGLPASGLHTNGYSLARRILFDTLALSVDSFVDELGGTVGEVLLRPHRSYLPLIRPLLDGGLVKGMAHITGGGLTDNVPRILPAGTAALVERARWTPPPVFAFLQRAGGVPPVEMFRTFNMGIGLVLVCSPEDVAAVLDGLGPGAGASVIGRIVEGDRTVIYDPPLGRI